MNQLDSLLASGQITAYCLGNLGPTEARHIKMLADAHPEIQAAIDLELGLLEQYAQGPAPRAGLKNQVIDFLDQHWTEAPVDLQNPPMIHPLSDRKAWSAALQNMTPDMEEPGYSLKILKDTPEHILSLVWLSESMTETKHDAADFLESFFILEGECECNFEGQIVRFGAGDYFEIPPNVDHAIKNISIDRNYVKGLVQRRKAA